MVDFVKKEWQFRDIISENELNRMEDGIEEGIAKAEQAQQTADDAATAAANAQSDIDAHLASSTPHATVKDVNLLGFSQVDPIQISDGAISVVRTFHVIDTEGGASTDELDTINGGGLHDILILQLANVNRKITIKNVSQGIGNIRTFDGTDIVLDHHYASVLLIKRNANEWAAFPVGVKRSGDTMTGTLVSAGTSGNIANSTPDRGRIVVRSASETDAAFMTFHRVGVYASYFGLDVDNKWKVGGWSAGPSAHEIWHAGNLPVESGTWTPELRFGGGTTGIQYAERYGRYKRVDNMVFIEVEIILTNKGTSSGTAAIAGLPFASSSQRPYHAFSLAELRNLGNAEEYNSFSGLIATSSTAIAIRGLKANGVLTNLNNNMFTDSTIITAQGFYLID